MSEQLTLYDIVSTCYRSVARRALVTNNFLKYLAIFNDMLAVTSGTARNEIIDLHTQIQAFDPLDDENNRYEMIITLDRKYRYLTIKIREVGASAFHYRLHVSFTWEVLKGVKVVHLRNYPAAGAAEVDLSKSRMKCTRLVRLQ